MTGLEDARSALVRGDLLSAYDAATAVLEHNAENLDARYLATLALVRSGSDERARDMIEGLQACLATHAAVSVELREDIEALAAREVKDRALRRRPRDVVEVRAAAEAYEQIGDRYDRYFACINAATLWRVAGEVKRARSLAQRAQRLVLSAGDDSYWGWATRAEAALILENVDEAADLLRTAAVAGRTDIAARATTRRQLRILCEAIGTPCDVVDLLELPSVLHYCGNMRPAIGFEQSDWERRIKTEVATFLDQTDVAIAYGSLAAGADILIAEELLDRRVEVHLVLPFATDDFERISVAAVRHDWVERFRACLQRVTSCTVACDSAHLDDETLFAFASRLAMGRARNRANFLGIDAVQLAVSDRAAWSAVAGTAQDVEVWRRAGGASKVIDLSSDRYRVVVPDGDVTALTGAGFYSVIFADFRGFSRLRDEHYDAFVTGLLGVVAKVVDDFRDSIAYRNTWGDGIQIILADVVSASHCALAIRDAVRSFRYDAVGLPRDLGLRIAAHVGRLVEIRDPLRDVRAFWGREMTRAARIEPRTPEGEVYVSEPFAALLALQPNSGCACEYVGRVTTAKDFETVPMYRLRPEVAG